MLRTVAFLVARRVLGLVGVGPAPDAKDVEIAVLRHQLVVLRRQVVWPRYQPVGCQNAVVGRELGVFTLLAGTR